MRWMVVVSMVVFAASAVQGAEIADETFELSGGVTNIYQVNTHGGTSTHNRHGRFSGSYDLELTSDLEKLLGLNSAELYIHGEGSWSRKSIDDTSVGSSFGVNGDFAARRSLDVTEVYYQQVFNDTLTVRAGKLDITGGFECHGCPVSFDASHYAHDEATQFLNSALVNNATIPFPDYGLGLVVQYEPVEKKYVSFGVVDAQADRRETGFRTTFHTEDYFFYIAETGFIMDIPQEKGDLTGTYRFGVWYDPQPKANTDRDAAGKSYRDDIGFYLSFDQQLIRENADPEDNQGLGAFFRYGRADSKTNDIVDFVSFGLSYQGLFDGRDTDVMGLGYAYGRFSDLASTTYRQNDESVIECYYRIDCGEHLHLSPSVQYVAGPGGAGGVSDALVAGLRAQIDF